MNEWTNDFTIQFLDAYEQEPILWNFNTIGHKDKAESKQAWNRLSDRLGLPVQELKRKKDSIMATFRALVRRRKASILAGASGEDIYRPVWFAYEKLESFLSEIYDCNPTQESLSVGEASVENEENQCDDSNFQENYQMPDSPAINDSTLINILAKKLLSKKEHEDDDCDLYGKLLAKKLRKIPAKDRDIVMYEIDGILINRLHNPSQDPLSPFKTHFKIVSQS